MHANLGAQLVPEFSSAEARLPSAVTLAQLVQNRPSILVPTTIASFSLPWLSDRSRFASVCSITLVMRPKILVDVSLLPFRNDASKRRYRTNSTRKLFKCWKRSSGQSHIFPTTLRILVFIESQYQFQCRTAFACAVVVNHANLVTI